MEISAISRGDACAYLEKFKLKDPIDGQTIAQAIENSACYRRTDENGQTVIAISGNTKTMEMWITAAAGKTCKPTAQKILSEVEGDARAQRYRLIGFQTIRRGLVRIAKRAGYTCTTVKPGCWHLRKALHAPD